MTAPLIRGRTNTEPGGSTTPTATMPTHAAGDMLVAFVAWEGAAAQLSSVNNDWNQLWYVQLNADGRFWAGYKVATSGSESGNQITLTQNSGQNALHVWAAYPCQLMAYASVSDASPDAFYDVPALTVNGSNGIQLLTATVVHGNRGAYALPGADDKLRYDASNYAWAPWITLNSQVDASTATNPGATTGDITGGPDYSRTIRLALGNPLRAGTQILMAG